MVPLLLTYRVFIRTKPVHTEPSLAVGRWAGDLESSGFARVEQRTADADRQNAVALLDIVFHDQIDHSHFAVRALPALVVKGHVEIQHRLAIEPQ